MTLTRSPALNGRMPSWRLSSVPWEPHQQVQRDALPSLLAMNAAYRKATGLNLDITDSYRALDGYWGQIATMLRRYKPLTEFRRLYPSWSRTQIKGRKSHLWNGVRRYLLPGESQAAFPGESNHGWGLAIDFGTVCRWWVQNHGARFGWVWPDWARGVEPWHIEATNLVVLIDAPKSQTPSTPLPNPDGTLPDPLDPKEPHVIDDNDIQKIARAVHEREVQYGSATVPLSLASGRAGRYSELLLPMRGEIAALRSLVEQVAEATGTPIDYERIKRDVREAVADGVTIDVTVTPKTQP